MITSIPACVETHRSKRTKLNAKLRWELVISSGETKRPCDEYSFNYPYVDTGPTGSSTANVDVLEPDGVPEAVKSGISHAERVNHSWGVQSDLLIVGKPQHA